MSSLLGYVKGGRRKRRAAGGKTVLSGTSGLLTSEKLAPFIAASLPLVIIVPQWCCCIRPYELVKRCYGHRSREQQYAAGGKSFSFYDLHPRRCMCGLSTCPRLGLVDRKDPSYCDMRDAHVRDRVEFE